MATNKLATIRYQCLDKCFRNPGRRYYIENLIEECNKAIYEFTGKEEGIKRRQIFDDIKFMESPQGWNIYLERVRDGHRIYYRYEDRNFSINNHLLNETEVHQLKEALTTLSKFKGLPQFEWISEISARIDSGLNLNSKKQNIIEFEQNHYLKGLEFITPLYNAIVYNQVIIIDYRSFKLNLNQQFTIHPYFLKQFNNRWFLFGWNEISERIINLAVDRIVEIANSNLVFKENNNIDFNEYFEDIVGVSVIPKIQNEKLVIKINNQLWPYIQSKPIHGSQKIIDRTDNTVSIELIVQINYELVSLLFSYMDSIEIIAPNTLRERFKIISERLFNKYF